MKLVASGSDQAPEWSSNPTSTPLICRCTHAHHLKLQLQASNTIRRENHCATKKIEEKSQWISLAAAVATTPVQGMWFVLDAESDEQAIALGKAGIRSLPMQPQIMN